MKEVPPAPVAAKRAYSGWTEWGGSLLICEDAGTAGHQMEDI
jgi:hypothetical protein